MPIHVIAITTHNKPPPTFLAQILRVTNGVRTGTDRKESLSHRGETLSLWRRKRAGKVLGRTAVLCPWMYWIAWGGGFLSPFIMNQLIRLSVLCVPGHTG